MAKKIYSFILLCVLTKIEAFNSFPIQPSLDSKNVIFFIDADNVQSRRHIPTALDLWHAKGLIVTIMKNKPFTWPYAIKRSIDFALKTIKAKESYARKELIIEDIIEFCNQNHYGDLALHKDLLYHIFFNVDPIEPMIKLLQKLNHKGYTLVTATNQNFQDHIIYKEKMKCRGVNLDLLFNAHITTSEFTSENESFKVNALKPSTEYFQFLVDNHKKLNPNAVLCILIDDRKDNVEEAINCGITGLHFALYNNEGNNYQVIKSIRTKDLIIAVEQLENQLISLGITY